MDRARLAQFLRSRRERTQPEEVGLPRLGRRRTPGLRREEIAELSGVATDYYTRIEQPNGPNPSPSVLASIGRALNLSDREEAHLHLLAGYAPARRRAQDGPALAIDDGLMQAFNDMQGLPAMIVTGLGETLLQTPSARAILGDETRHTGLARFRIHRWFTDPAERTRTPPVDHARHSRTLVSQLTSASVHPRFEARAAQIATSLLPISHEFRKLWAEQPIAEPRCAPKRILGGDTGPVLLRGTTLVDAGAEHALLLLSVTEDTSRNPDVHFTHQSGR